MSNEMIEKVAKAIAARGGDVAVTDYERILARAAIQAMAEPTDEMIFEGLFQYDKCQDDLRNYVSGETPDWDSGMISCAVWKAMHKAALELDTQDAGEDAA